MSVWINRWFSYFLSLSLVTVILVYTLDLPTLISGAPDLVGEYYYDNPVKSFVLDIFLIAAYISMGMILSNMLNISHDNQSGQISSLALATGIISSMFMGIFLMQNNSSFFSRWFRTVGFGAVIYDIIIVCSVYVVMIQLNKTIINRNPSQSNLL